MVPSWQDVADESTHGFKCKIERHNSGIDVHGCKIERTPLTMQALLGTDACLHLFEVCRRKHDNFTDMDSPCNPKSDDKYVTIYALFVFLAFCLGVLADKFFHVTSS